MIILFNRDDDGDDHSMVSVGGSTSGAHSTHSGYSVPGWWARRGAWAVERRHRLELDHRQVG